MGAAERRVKDQTMAADMVRRGIYHGKRLTSTTCHPIPKLGDSGSAAYRRMQKMHRSATYGKPTEQLKRYTVANPPTIDPDEKNRNRYITLEPLKRLRF